MIENITGTNTWVYAALSDVNSSSFVGRSVGSAPPTSPVAAGVTSTATSHGYALFSTFSTYAGFP